MNNILFALPEIFLAACGMLLLLLGAWRGHKGMGLVAALAICAFVVTGYLVITGGNKGVAMGGMFAVDGFRAFIKVMILAASGFAISLSPLYFKEKHEANPELPVLGLFATLGMMLMVSAHDLIALYVGLELQNLALYVLVSARRDEMRSSEAGVKYLTLGALSSAILLFGLSLVYGFAGTTSFEGLAQYTSSGEDQAAGFAAGIAFVIAGFAFKISAVPFHMWTPDVYEGAPTPVTAFLTAAPKMAAMALLVCVIAGPFAQSPNVWQPLLIFLSVASMVVGSIGGLLQTNIKRLMAYSAIANIGTILVGLVVFNKAAPVVSTVGLQGILLYLIFYAAGTIGVFALVLSMRRHHHSVETLTDLAGLAKGHPTIAAALAALLFSLAGIPPLAGFFGKYFVLLTAVQAGMTWLAVAGVVTSVVAAGYYLRVIKIMYFDLQKGLPLTLDSGRIPQLVAGVATAMVLLFVLMPEPLVNGARLAAESLLHP